MFITKKHLSRRTFLRGAGVTLALPFLDSMVGAQTLLKNTAASPKTRLGCIYVPHGATMSKWTPATEGPDFQFTETLSPLEKYRDHTTVVSNLVHASATGADAGAEHARSAAIFLSGGRPQKNAVRVGVTLDQVAAEHIGQDTPLPSIELGIEEVSLSCGAGYGCAYFNTISWRTPTVPLPVENSPQAVFEKLFGDGGTTAQRLARKREDRSILDSVLEQTHQRCEEGCRSSDRVRVDGYLDDIREIERRIKTVLDRNAQSVDPLERPRRTGRHAGGVRRASQADVRSADAGLSERNDPGLDADVRQGSEPDQLSRRAAIAADSTAPRIMPT